jgi:hypothetical protein
MLRKLAIVGILVLILAAAYGAAASLALQGGSIQAGVDATLYCDVDGVNVESWGLETDDSTSHYVRIAGIDAACLGNYIFVRVEDSGGGPLYFSGKTALLSPVMTFNFPSPINAGSIEHLKVWIEGGF